MLAPTALREEIFISYSREDARLVQPFARLIAAAGLIVFLDEMSVEPGERWEQALDRALARCTRAFVFWSARAAASAWVEREIHILAERSIPVVPVLLDDTPMTAELGQFQGISLQLLAAPRVPLPPGSEGAMINVQTLGREPTLTSGLPIPPDDRSTVSLPWGQMTFGLGAAGLGAAIYLVQSPPPVAVYPVDLGFTDGGEWIAPPPPSSGFWIFVALAGLAVSVLVASGVALLPWLRRRRARRALARILRSVDAATRGRRRALAT